MVEKTMDSYAIWFAFLITHSGGNFGCPYCLKRYFKRSSETVSFWLKGQIFPFDFKQRLLNMSFMVTLHERVLLLMPITTTLKIFILCSRKFSTSSLKNILLLIAKAFWTKFWLRLVNWKSGGSLSDEIKSESKG